MKPEDIRTNTVEELAVIEGDLRRQLWKARFDNHTNQLDDTSSSMVFVRMSSGFIARSPSSGMSS